MDAPDDYLQMSGIQHFAFAAVQRITPPGGEMIVPFAQKMHRFFVYFCCRPPRGGRGLKSSNQGMSAISVCVVLLAEDVD